MEEDLEDARERYFWELVLKAVWSSLIILFASGVLSWLTVFLGWQEYLILCFVGLLAGILITVGISGSPRSRDLIALALGAVILPIWAAYLAAVAVRSRSEFSVYSIILSPFFAYAIGTTLSGLVIAKIWQKKPGRPRPDEEEEEFPEAIGLTTPIKEPTARAAKETTQQAAKAEEVKA